MGMEIPGELRSLLGVLGFTWPEADETALAEMGRAWMAFSDRLESIVADATSIASEVWTEHEGQAVAAFQAWWAREDSPAPALLDGANAATLTGTGLMICGGIVLALKVAVIAQLAILAVQIAQAVATAVPTFGASLLEIPIFQQLSRVIVGNLVEDAMVKLLDG
ncbi:hypothetical protein M1L60_13530 [Actinoplanes sp. TRM 88003]|uniref:Outer membrane channel protein CpnT-like N-terminal domain-containing protein n=1 Tax=Paractinoplanes aksuensis TaxID=2939490 RepID=A0ABT1DLA6_9ACTN|nr:hypothetical protein [Actinoplanes aksuensis]MCO8271612.1 hypothetical protein [Actinoplanes aksuensis]